MAVVLRASRAAAVVLVMCALLLEGSEAAMTGKKLRTYLQKKMYQGIGGDPTRPVAKFSANDLVDVISVRCGGGSGQRERERDSTGCVCVEADVSTRGSCGDGGYQLSEGACHSHLIDER